MNNINEMIRDRFRVRRRYLPPFLGEAGDRKIFAKLLADAGLNYGAEIGTRDGDLAKLLCETNPDLKLVCIDPWHAYGNVPEEIQQKRFVRASERLSRYNIEIVREFSMNALSKVADNSLDFVYIDGAHDFDNAMIDIIHWTKKVKSGGIVSGHDYFRLAKSGVMTAVDAYTKEHDIREWYITHEIDASFLWVKK